MHLSYKAVYNCAQIWYNIHMKEGKSNMSLVNWVATPAKANKSEPAAVRILGGDLPADHDFVKVGRSMDDAVDLIECLISEDYKTWSNIPEEKTVFDCQPGESDVIAENMYHKFATTLSNKKGSKYIKIMTGSGVWGFIVNTKNDKKFKYGDLLKAAGYNAPARNFARGNVIDDTVENLRVKSVRWTGVRY